MEWIDANKELPYFDVDVLCYYEIESKKDGTYKYMVIGYVRSITSGKDYKNAEWVDKEYNNITPTHWMTLPEPPKK